MTARKLAKALGWIVSLACLAFFAWEIHQSGLSTPGRGVGENILLVLAGAVVYGAAVALLALIWSDLAAAAPGKGAIGRAPLVQAYLIGQFAKYLPGNVFQFAARHGLGLRAGVGHGALATAAVAEIYLLLCAGATVAIALGLPTVRALAPAWPTVTATLALLGLLAPFALCLPHRLLPAPTWLPVYRASVIARATMGYLVFFLVFGALYVLCLAWSTSRLPPVAPGVGSAAVAWVAGFILPGAPAGAGLREAALSVGFEGLGVAASEILASILLFRAMTLGGDLLAFALGGLLRRRAATG